MYDISPPITPDLAVWPGDTPPSREVLLDMRNGDNLTLSTFRSTVHAGSHVDAPSHYGSYAPTIDGMSLERYIGPCEVMRVVARRGVGIEANMLPRSVKQERVLFSTGTYPDPNHFNEDFAALSPELVRFLSGEGVKLIGIDTPSVDLFSSKELPAHNACLMHDVLILEGLVLGNVPDGDYELIALPLKLVGFDASPVRAILRSM